MKTKSYFLAGGLLAAFGFAANGAITLGDVAIVGLSGDTKTITWVALNSLVEGDTLNFTDSGWLDTNTFRGNEGGATFTVPVGGIAAGTVLTAVGSSNTEWDALTNYAAISNTDVGTNGLNLSTSGDQAFAFTGSSAAPTFVFGVQSNSTDWQTTAASSNDSALPAGLTDGANAVSFGAGSGAGDEFDNIWYSGPTSFSSPTLALAAIANEANWTGDNTNYTPITSIAVPEPSTYAAIFGALGLACAMMRRRRKD